jgi:hypothetical protein
MAEYIVELKYQDEFFPVRTYCAENKKDAVSTARRWVYLFPENKVFVGYYRSVDGQNGYINDDGNFSLWGKPWGEKR